MIVAGVMSGTSADGIDVAIVRIQGRPPALRFQLLHHLQRPYPLPLRRAVLAAMDAHSAGVADLARLNVRLSKAYADAIGAACKQAGMVHADLIGCHGQTIYHQGFPSPYLGSKVATTWQLGDGNWIAAETETPVVSDFRHADMAAGGKGAPLVPFFDFLAYRHRSLQRVVLNLGGIANITILPPGARPQDVLAFDTGPGNMVIDACVDALTKGKYTYDPEGRLAAQGKIDETVLGRALRHRFFRLPPPKSAGREEFGADYARSLLQRLSGRGSEDVIATATAITAASIAHAIRNHAPSADSVSGELIVSGGGTRNLTLLRTIEERVNPLGYKLITTDALGLPSQAKEAVAFAVLAYESWHRRPANLPSATGARRAAILGKISHA